jgi:hypothetical protein
MVRVVSLDMVKKVTKVREVLLVRVAHQEK